MNLLRHSLTVMRRMLQQLVQFRRAVRHAWMRSKVSYRTRRSFDWAKLRVRQVFSYAPPDERRECPACGGRRVKHLEPLSITRPASVRWKFGFITGCHRCGVLFANPMPSARSLDTVYSPVGDWGRHRQREEEKAFSARRLAWLFEPVAGGLDVLRPRPGAAVLDFGCGLGGMLDALQDVGWITYGVEPATAIAFRRHRRLTDLPDEARFDLVLLNHVLEHVAAPLNILRQLAGVTADGGTLLVRVPNLEGVGKHLDLKYCIRSKTHLMAYSVPCLRWLLAEAGFEVITESVRTERDTRHLVVLARRSRQPVLRPSRPLDAARLALRAYARHVSSDGDWRLLPVRVRAAILNMSRGRRPAHAGVEPAAL